MGFFLDEGDSSGGAPAAPALGPGYADPMQAALPSAPAQAPKGFFLDETPSAPTPAPQSPMQSFAGHLGNVVNDMTLGYGDELIGAGGGLTDYLGGKLGELLGNGQQTPALMDLVDQNYNDIKGAREGYQREYPTFSLLDNVAALKMPVPDVFSKQTGILAALGNTAKGTGLGAAYGGAAGYGSTDGDFTQRLQGALSGAGWGAATGGATSGLLEALQGIGGKLGEWAPGMNRASIGARVGDYSKTADSLGSTALPQGDLSTLTKNSLDEFLADPSIGTNRDPEYLFNLANNKEKSLASKVDTIISGYDQNVGLPVYPKFNVAEDLIDSGKVPANEVQNYRNRLSDLRSGIKTEGDGSLAYLQQQKIAYGTKWDPSDKILNKFNRAVYTDLQKAIESVTPDVAPLNAELQKIKVIQPILDRGVTTSEASNPLKSFMQNIRISGGFGVPGALIGHAIGGMPGALIGSIGAGALGSKITSPQGEALMAALMQSGSKLGPLAASAEGAIPAISSLAGSYQQQDKSAYQASHVSPILPKRSPLPEQLLQHLSSSPNPTTAPALSNPAPDLLSAQRVSGKASKADTNLDTLAAAVQSQESKGDAKAVSSKGARGLMQIMPDTAKDIAKELGVKNYDLEDPKTNQLFGRYYLQKMLDQFDGDPELALAGYNMGPNALNKIIKRVGSSDWSKISRYLQDEGIYSETRKYVPSVLKRINSVEA